MFAIENTHLVIFHSQTFYSITQFVPNCCISSSFLICTFHVRKITHLVFSFTPSSHSLCFAICKTVAHYFFLIGIEILGTHNPSFRSQNPYGFLSLHRIICSYGFARLSPRLHPTKISKKKPRLKIQRLLDFWGGRFYGAYRPNNYTYRNIF